MYLFQKSEEERRREIQRDRIEKATQSEQFRKPNPRTVTFPEENFIDFRVVQEGQTIKLNTYRSPPHGELKAIVFMFHGLGAYINHGAHVAKELSSIGCLVVGFDHRGFGKSEGYRGYLEDIQLHLHDSVSFVHKVLEMIPQKVPIFLTGLSMGGMTSFRLAVENRLKVPIKGLVLFAPAIKPIHSSFMIQGAKVLGFLSPKGKFLKPKRGIATKNPKVSEDHFNDPYTYTQEMLPKTASTILSAMQESEKLIPQLKTPWLLVQGGLDKLVDPEVVHALQSQSPSSDKTVLFYDDMWHDIWHEEEIVDIIPKVRDWIKARI